MGLWRGGQIGQGTEGRPRGPPRRRQWGLKRSMGNRPTLLGFEWAGQSNPEVMQPGKAFVFQIQVNKKMATLLAKMISLEVKAFWLKGRWAWGCIGGLSSGHMCGCKCGTELGEAWRARVEAPGEPGAGSTWWRWEGEGATYYHLGGERVSSLINTHRQ